MTIPRIRAAMFIFICVLLALGMSYGLGQAKPGATTTETIVADQECAKCEGKCKAWIDKCKEGGQYACYKAAACLCKCNLDAGGCGSSKEALQECYEKNEKLAKDLGPDSEQGQ
jgi:hypothetical protein